MGVLSASWAEGPCGGRKTPTPPLAPRTPHGAGFSPVSPPIPRWGRPPLHAAAAIAQAATKNKGGKASALLLFVPPLRVFFFANGLRCGSFATLFHKVFSNLFFLLGGVSCLFVLLLHFVWCLGRLSAVVAAVGLFVLRLGLSLGRWLWLRFGLGRRRRAFLGSGRLAVGSAVGCGGRVSAGRCPFRFCGGCASGRWVLWFSLSRPVVAACGRCGGGRCWPGCRRRLRGGCGPARSFLLPIGGGLLRRLRPLGFGPGRVRPSLGGFGSFCGRGRRAAGGVCIVRLSGRRCPGGFVAVWPSGVWFVVVAGFGGGAWLSGGRVLVRPGPARASIVAGRSVGWRGFPMGRLRFGSCVLVAAVASGAACVFLASAGLRACLESKKPPVSGRLFFHGAVSTAVGQRWRLGLLQSQMQAARWAICKSQVLAGQSRNATAPLLWLQSLHYPARS